MDRTADAARPRARRRLAHHLRGVGGHRPAARHRRGHRAGPAVAGHGAPVRRGRRARRRRSARRRAGQARGGGRARRPGVRGVRRLRLGRRALRRGRPGTVDPDCAARPGCRHRRAPRRRLVRRRPTVRWPRPRRRGPDLVLGDPGDRSGRPAPHRRRAGARLGADGAGGAQHDRRPGRHPDRPRDRVRPEPPGVAAVGRHRPAHRPPQPHRARGVAERRGRGCGAARTSPCSSATSTRSSR